MQNGGLEMPGQYSNQFKFLIQTIPASKTLFQNFDRE